MWDRLPLICIDKLGSATVYVDAATGTRKPIKLIPIDEGETYRAMKGLLEVDGGVVIGQVLESDVPLPITGDRLEYAGWSYEVQSPTRQLNGVWELKLVSPYSV